MIRMGQVIIVEVNSKNIFSRLIGWITRSHASHCLLVSAEGKVIEARYPKVIETDLLEALTEFREKDRAYVVLDLVGQTILQRYNIAMKGRTFLGRNYDVLQILLFAITGRFWDDGPLTLVCSRIISESFMTGGHETLWTEDVLARNYAEDDKRLSNIRSGFVVPADYLRSRLTVVDFSASSRVTEPAGLLRSDDIAVRLTLPTEDDPTLT